MPTVEPTALMAGDTWAWRREDLADYPAAAGWVLSYAFRNASHYFSLTASADGDAYAVQAAASVTANYVPGRYDWWAFVTLGTERYSVGTGALTVTANVATAAPYDGRVWARQMLDAVNSALLGRASREELDLVNQQLDGRGLTRSPEGLITLRSKLEAEATREERAATGQANNLPLRVRFR